MASSWRVDPIYVQSILQQLVRLDSVNPSLVAGGAGEAAVAAYVAAQLAQLGLSVQLNEVAPGRPNVVGRLAGRGNGRSLLLNAHMDTVGVAGMIDPFAGIIRDGRLYGRGAYDMKGGLAAMLGAAHALTTAGASLQGDLLITAVADEEYASLGTEHLVQQVRADAAIVTEPTDLALCRAHRGFIWFRVETFGRAAHGSRFREGVDANMHMGRFLAELDKLEQALRQRPPYPLVGTPSLHAALLSGGSALSVYAAHCTLQIERRTIPGETIAGAAAELQAIVEQLAAADPTFQARVTPFFARSPFEIAASSPLVAMVEDVMAAHLRQPPPHMGQTFWTDAALLADAGMETVIIGPRGAGLHSDEEWVEISSVVDLAQILTNTALRYCGAA
ncbi:MAG: ArgE/DapE family deacylase [Candidatus Promineifilaceae bacterium]